MNNNGLNQIVKAIENADVSLLDLISMEEAERTEILNAIATLRKFAMSNGQRMPLKLRPHMSLQMHGTLKSAVEHVLRSNDEPLSNSMIHHALLQAGYAFKIKDKQKQRDSISRCLSASDTFERRGADMWQLKAGEAAC